MDKRNEVMQGFGPKLIEAIIEATLKEINLLRTIVGQPVIDKEQFLDSITTEQNKLSDYEAFDDKEEDK